MANRERGETTLVAGKQSFVCRLTTNSCAEVEDFASRTWQDIWLGMKSGSVNDVRLFFWVALREHHSDIATDDKACLRKVGEIIDAAGGLRSDKLSAWITRFIELNQDQDEKDDKKGGQPRAGAADPQSAQADDGASSTETRVLSA